MVDRIPEEEQLSMIAKNFKPELRAGMERKYFERYKALMHVANKTEEELAKVAKLKKVSSRYKKPHPQLIKYGRISIWICISPKSRGRVKTS